MLLTEIPKYTTVRISEWGPGLVRQRDAVLLVRYIDAVSSLKVSAMPGYSLQSGVLLQVDTINVHRAVCPFLHKPMRLHIRLVGLLQKK